jgi:TRAP transporter 4TM/12TM fusion protein
MAADPENGTRLEVTDAHLGDTAEMRTRTLEGSVRRFARGVGVAMSIFHVVVLGFYSTDPQKLYAMHLLFASILAFLLVPARKASDARPTLWDWTLVAASAGVVAYQLLYFRDITGRAGVAPNAYDVAAGVTVLVVIVEMVRRVTGWAMPILGAVFLIYAFAGPWMPGMFQHRGFDFATTISFLFSDNGIYGVAIAASARYVFLFIVFGALLEVSGIGRFIVNLGLSVAGHLRGGPAKVSIITSALFGTANGSSAANVMVDGVINVPLMKSVGFRPAVAGAIEAMNSTGGQIVPPVMGAAAFIMADIIGVPYSHIAVAAIIPALLYYVSAYWMIDLYSARHRLSGLPREQLPVLRVILARQGYFVIPLALMLVLIMVFDYSPFRAALWAMGATVLASWRSREGRLAHPWMLTAVAGYATASWAGAPVLLSLGAAAAAGAGAYAARPEARPDVDRALDALYMGAQRSVEIAGTTAAAGVIVGVLSLTGLGEKFSLALVQLAHGNVITLLVAAMVIALVLGMGLPTTADYAIMASTLAPAILQLGVAPLAGHLFLFYFACLSAITPPVALAAYAAASIAQAPIWKTGWQAVRFALAGFVVPYMFVFGPALLMRGSWPHVVWAVATATLGTLCLAGAVVGYLFKPATWPERALLLAAALALIDPQVLTDAVGLACFALAASSQRLRGGGTAAVLTGEAVPPGGDAR